MFAKLFDEYVNVEAAEHCSHEADALGLAKTDEASLLDRMAGEHYENTRIYVQFANEDAAGDKKAAAPFRQIAADEGDRYRGKTAPGKRAPASGRDGAECGLPEGPIQNGRTASDCGHDGVGSRGCLRSQFRLRREGEPIPMHLHFLGTGDAFGSGGRFNTCFLVERGELSLLIDCGASSLIAIRRFGADPNSIAAIMISHLHGDHFGGLPFFILDAQIVSRRTRPLLVIGPQGMAQRVEALMEAAFPGSWKAARGFAIEMVEIRERTPIAAADAAVTGFPVRHPSGAPSLALRCECDGRVIAYTGDTEWTEELLAAGRAADLLIAEASTFDRPIPFHLDFATLRENLPRIGARRVVLTHMSPDMLERDADAFPGCERAFDGMRIEL